MDVGIGVRASVYAQACLAAINVIYLVHTRVFTDVPQAAASADVEMAPLGSDPPLEQGASTGTSSAVLPQSIPITRSPTPPPHPSHPSQNFLLENAEYLNMAKSLERSLFMVGFAVIISAILQTKSTTGLTPYHALIVLNISQINSWAGFLLLISRGGIRNTGIGWMGDVLVTKRSLVDAMPCIVHGTVMSAFGLYFWSDTQAFLRYVDEPGSCRPLTMFWLFSGVAVSNNSLRIASLVFYAINIIPMIGIYLQGVFVVLALIVYVIAVTLLILVSCVVAMIFAILFALINVLVLKPIAFALKPVFRVPFVRDLVPTLSKGFRPVAQALRQGSRFVNTSLHQVADLLVGPSYSTLFTFTTGFSFVAPLLFTVISTEFIIRANASNVDQSSEYRWTYGQTLALFSALIAAGMYASETLKLMRASRARKKNTTGAALSGSDTVRLTAEKDIQTDIVCDHCASLSPHNEIRLRK